MREHEVPALASRTLTGGLADMVVENAERDPANVLFGVRSGSEWLDRTAAEFRSDVLAVAKGLVAKGIEPGDRVGLMSRTRYEWTLLDYALWMIGACPVPVYPTSSAQQVAWILSDAGAVACVVEHAENAATVEAVRHELPALRELWSIDDDAVATLRETGAAVDDADIERRRLAVEPDQPATLVYTSGTTGRPKGCVLTHRNFFDEVDNAIELLYPVFREQSKYPASTVIFIPLAHVLGRMLQVGCVRAGVKVGHQPSIAQVELRQALRTFRPTFLLGVPYVFEKVYNTARYTAEKLRRGSSFDRSVRIATKLGEALERQHTKGGPGPGLGLRLAGGLYDLLVYRRIRNELGGRLRYAICGGSPLGRRLGLFFAGAGILIYEGYGLTETTAASTVNPPLAPKFGTVGQPLPGAAVRIADDGEILIRGGQVFTEYWNNPDATKQTFDGEWFATGDVGELDDEGYLTVTGRKKDILVTSGGKNVAPGPLEDQLRAHPLVSQCLIVGDNRPFVAALITLDAEAATDWAKLHLESDQPVEELAHRPEVIAEVRRAVDRANESVSRAESIREFRLLSLDFTEENGLLTPSMKVRRQAIVQAFADQIDDIYRQEPRQGRRGEG